ncbi:DEAD/DEAH box helicase [Brevibacillus brevis]|uniref:Helicase-related protein n=1 Tax=Brevibacillus brevis TaxID=1393 RepID=A0ABY9T6C2_BREBE|nr:DEAD/DEAH box helicase [Brevibacillus brevis]WNC14472.1 helicase-related protein [Brevibacillus brevis]
MREYLLYIKTGETTAMPAQAYVTPCFAVDQSFWREREGCRLHVIGRSPSLALVFSLREAVNARLQERRASSQPWSEEGLSELRQLAVARVREANALYACEAGSAKPLGRTWFTWEDGEGAVRACRSGELWPESAPLADSPTADTSIRELLAGRALLWEELVTLLGKQDVAIEEPDLMAMLQRMVLGERAEWRPGVCLSVAKGWRRRLDLFCERCGSGRRTMELTVCHTCGQGCAYCTACLGMGRSKCCTPYLLVPAPLLSAGEQVEARLAATLDWNGSYSPAQAVAAEQARRFVAAGRPGLSQFLIWAVCGAGKTELLFPSIAEALSAGGRVLIATPRKDVVLELAPRIQRVFPHARVIAVHGSSPEKWEDAQITIATTHQVMRYYQRFPLVVLDEADAFPYHNNPMLYRAVARAVQRGEKLLYLSATPPRYLRKSLVVKTTGMLSPLFARPMLKSATHVLLPGRYHGHALPVPQVVTVQGLHKRLRTGRPITALLELVRRCLESERQLFLFVPRIEDVDRVVYYLASFFPDAAPSVAGVHAADPMREEKVRAFREKRYRLMVTTTILERGVTIPRSDVAVIGAEAPVFDEASLVQIAGRVGRSADDPAGTVLYLQADRAASPRAAVRQIRRMNQLADLLRARGQQA